MFIADNFHNEIILYHSNQTIYKRVKHKTTRVLAKEYSSNLQHTNKQFDDLCEKKEKAKQKSERNFLHIKF